MSEQETFYGVDVLYQPQGLSIEAILGAYYTCFVETPAGRIVLRDLQEGLIAADINDMRDLWRVRLYQAIMRNLRAYEALQQRRSDGRSGTTEG